MKLKQVDNLLDQSIITYFEIIGGLIYKQAQKQLSDFEDFVGNNNIIHISEPSAKISGKLYADLRQQGIIIGTSDLLIEGIALENNLTLIINNEKHYAHIPGLRVENWKFDCLNLLSFPTPYRIVPEWDDMEYDRNLICRIVPFGRRCLKFKRFFF